MISRIFLFLVVIIISSCKSTKQATTNELPMIMLEKTTCMGACPAYKFMVYPDGSATYHGKANVNQVGDYTAQLTEDQLNYLKNSFVDADFFSFANVYSANLTDLPTTYIYYHNGKQNLKVTDYYGAPESLKALEKHIEVYIDSIDWKKQ